MTRLKQQARIMAAVQADMLARVSLPVDVTDASAFPEIALAIAHARKMRGDAALPEKEMGHG